MSSIIHEHFKQNLIDFKGSFISRIGGMHFTNFQIQKFQFGPRTELLVQYHRILPCLDSCQQDFAILEPIGVFPEVLEGVSPDHARQNISYPDSGLKLTILVRRKGKQRLHCPPPPSQSCSEAGQKQGQQPAGAYPLSLPLLPSCCC